MMVAAKEHDQIRTVVVHGQRPDLSVITGPEILMYLAVDWIERCWHQNPDRRPSFAGILCQLLSHYKSFIDTCCNLTHVAVLITEQLLVW